MHDSAQTLSQTFAAIRLTLRWMGITRSLTAQQKEDLGGRDAVDVAMISASRKILDPAHPAMKRINSIRTKIRKVWMESSLPYVETGIRLIPRKDIRGFHDRMTRLKQELVQASRELESDFEHLRRDAERRLGHLFDPADYPDSVEGLFALDWSVMEVQPPQYLMRLDPQLYRLEEERVKARFQEAVEMAEQAFLTEFSGLVNHLAERLSEGEHGEKKVFRDTAVDNLKGFMERFRNLNVTNNGDLDRLVNQVQDLLAGITPQHLRTRSGWRHAIATNLSTVQTQLDGMMINRPRRRITRMETEHAVAS